MKVQRSVSCSVLSSQTNPTLPNGPSANADLNQLLTSDSSKPFYRVSSEHSRRLITFGYNLTSSVTDAFVVYPCLVLRRRCQVSCMGRRYHLTPVSIIDVAIRLQRSQGITCLWKGVGSHLMINAMAFGVESSMSEFNENLAIDVNRHSKVKKLLGHVVLKALSAAVVMPFYSSHLVESVESEAASEPRGIFGFIFEGLYRLAGYAGIQSHRLLPFRNLLIPTVLYFLAKYLLSNLLEILILTVFRYNEKRKHDLLLKSAHPFSPAGTDVGSVPGVAVTKDRSLDALYMKRTACIESQYHEFLSTFFASLVTDILLYPVETVVFRLHVQGTRTIIDDMDRGKGFLPVSSRHEGFSDCYRTIKSVEGRLGFFRGFGSLMLQYAMRFSIFKLVHLVSTLYS